MASNYRDGRKISLEGLKDINRLNAQAEGVSFKGWIVGLFAVAALAIMVPYSDFVIRATLISFNAFPLVPITLLVFLLVMTNLAIGCCKGTLGLTRQDLTLIFCMTTVAFAIPGLGFWWSWSNIVAGTSFFARPENNWAKLIFPYQDALPGYFIRDPEGGKGVLPVEWFFQGLPNADEKTITEIFSSIPWAHWSGPYLRWTLVVVMMYGIYFCVAALLQRRWSQQERLQFPLTHVAAELIMNPGSEKRPGWGFLGHTSVLWGIGIVFGLWAYNSIASVTNFQDIPLWFQGLHTKYFTEMPFKAIGKLEICFLPTVLGMTFLLPLEISFSLWMFYFIRKLCFFMFGDAEGSKRLEQVMQSQGMGALLALAVVSFWTARSELMRTFKLAILGNPDSEQSDFNPRLYWFALIACFAGTVVWLINFGVGPLWAISIVLLFILVMTGLARLISEAGVFSVLVMQDGFPANFMAMVATPATIGAKDVALTTMWDRVFSVEFFRIVPLPNIMNCMHLSTSNGLHLGTTVKGMFIAVIVTLALSFGSFLTTAYTKGATTFGGWWGWKAKNDYDPLARQLNALNRWDTIQQEAQQTGRVVRAEEIPAEAKRDWGSILGMFSGVAVLLIFTGLRRVIMWWPHPVGFVLWLSAAAGDKMWFSFLLAYLIKWGITRFGGNEVYIQARRFFIGMVIGEALAAVCQILLSNIVGQATGRQIWLGFLPLF